VFTAGINVQYNIVTASDYAGKHGRNYRGVFWVLKHPPPPPK